MRKLVVAIGIALSVMLAGCGNSPITRIKHDTWAGNYKRNAAQNPGTLIVRQKGSAIQFNLTDFWVSPAKHGGANVGIVEGTATIHGNTAVFLHAGVGGGEYQLTLTKGKNRINIGYKTVVPNRQGNIRETTLLGYGANVVAHGVYVKTEEQR